MLKTENYMQMTDGHDVYVRTYAPDLPVIGHIHILHGMAEHSGRYNHFATYLCEHGYYVSLHDHRGHGKTAERSGELGFIAEEHGFDLLVEDACQVMQQVRSGKNLPQPILFGHSMGSFIARRFIQLYSNQIEKVILCGTASTTTLHRLGKYVGQVLVLRNGKQAPSQLLNDLSFGSYNKQIKSPKTIYDWLCSNPETVQKYIEDSYCGFIASTQFFVDLTTGLLLIDKHTELKKMRHDLPVLFTSGHEDAVGENGKGIFKVAQQFTDVGMEDVTVHLFEKMRHEILNEIQHELVFKVILRWLEKT